MIANNTAAATEMQPDEIEQLHILINASPDVICSFDEEGRFSTVSKACIHLWGYTQEELLGKNYIDFVVEEDRSKTLLVAKDIMNGDRLTNFENHYRRKDGSIVSIIWAAVWNDQKKAMFCVAKDGTEKKKAEKLTKVYEERLYRAYKLSKLGWWEWDMVNGGYLASDELYSIYGFSREDYPVITIEKFLVTSPKIAIQVKE